MWIALLAAAALGACGDARTWEGGCSGVGGPEIIAEVRDQDGKPAAAGATLSIRDGGYAADTLGVGDGTTTRVAAGDGHGGVFTVTVTKPGYDAVTIENVRVPSSWACWGADRPVHVEVTLRLRPDAPPVRSVTMNPRLMGYVAGFKLRVEAHVDAAPGVPTTVRWRVSDTTVATISPDGRLTGRCRPVPGTTHVTAISTADSTKRDSGAVEVMAEQSPTIHISLTRSQWRPISGDRLSGPARVLYDAKSSCSRIARVELVLARGGREVVAASALGADTFRDRHHAHGELRFDTARHPAGSYTIFARLVPEDGSAPIRSSPAIVWIDHRGG